MKMLSGVLSGLIIGAALVFATLAVLGIVAKDGACTRQAPTQWALRLDVPGEQLQARMPAQTIAVGAASYTMDGLSATDCGDLLVMGTLAGPGMLRLESLGVELSLHVDGGDLSLRPSRLWFGRLPVDLGWVPESWWAPALGGVDAQLSAMVADGLAGSGMQVCGVAGHNGCLSLYVCEAGTPAD